MKKLVAYGGIAAGVTLMGAAFYAKPIKRFAISKPVITDSMRPLLDFVKEETLLLISTNYLWMELCDRMADFAPICKEEYIEFLNSVANMVTFQQQLDSGEKKTTVGTPRLLASKLHEIIECVRVMRAAIADKAEYALNDFDEIAIDVQKKHDDDAYNIMLESTSKL